MNVGLQSPQPPAYASTEEINGSSPSAADAAVTADADEENNVQPPTLVAAPKSGRQADDIYKVLIYLVFVLIVLETVYWLSMLGGQ